MISLNEFVKAIHDAIMQSHDSLITSDLRLLDEFFVEEEDENGDKTLRAKTVVVQYPVQSTPARGDDSKAGQPSVEVAEVHVPLITLVPLSNAGMEKAKLEVDFDLEFADNHLQLTFAKTQSSHGEPSQARNKMEITISPQESPDGLKMLVEGYEAILKRQIP